jgi:hypothetical protein
MTTAERINETLRRLPVAFQQEVLEYAESLIDKSGDENGDVNGDSDEDRNLELMRQVMADPLFVADLEEVSDDFRYVDADEVVS